MSLLKIAQVPPSVVHPGASVLEAVRAMDRDKVGGVAVLEDGELRGIFTERDVMLRVALRELDPRETRVGAVMTSPVETTSDDTTEEEALTRMIQQHVRHLPIVGKDGQLLGMLSIRNVLEHQVDILSRELHSLGEYLANDGPGG
jgi:CBS domain-containing protein